MIVMTTGHRPQRLQGKEKEISEWYAATLASLQPEVCISGMAAGADTLFALAAIDAGRILWCYYPYLRPSHDGQEEYIREYASKRWAAFKTFSRESYSIRDKAMVDDSDVVLAVYDGKPAGGTYATIEYAKSKGKQIIYFPNLGYTGSSLPTKEAN